MSSKCRIRRYHKIDDSQALSPLLQRIYGARGISSLTQLDYSLQQLINPNEIINLSHAAQFIAESIQQQKKFLIIGDYDADGATSTALMVKGLTSLGLVTIDYILPDRVTEGYGLSQGLVDRVMHSNPDIVITVDTGISSIEGIKTLKDSAIDVIVSDHHLPSDVLPNANFIVNPNAYDKSVSPKGRCLAGVGVAFYILLGIRARLRSQAYFSEHLKEPNLALLLDLVALGTVADLVPLDHLNRVLVAQGLELIKRNQCCEGIKNLFLVSNKNQSQANHQDLAFAIAPRINAVGRIDNMALGVQCLLSQGYASKHLAEQLNDINSQRRSLQSDMQIDSDELLNALYKNDAYPKGIVLCHKDWHEGIVGIVASQIKSKIYRPVLVFAYADNGTLKGSGRSISGIHLRDVLDLIDKRNNGLIIKFGGHAMAAGLSINASRIDDFKQAFNSILNELYSEDTFLQSRLSDGELSSQELNIKTAEELNKAGPWGQLFEEPEFVGTFQVVQQRILKEQHIRLVLSQKNSNETIDAIAFFCTEEQLKTQFKTIQICYKLSINEFRNQRSLQLMISEFMSLGIHQQ